MSTGAFDIVADSANRLIRIGMVGNWDGDTVSRYKDALTHAVERMRREGCPRGTLSALIDARGLSAQTQEALESYRRRFGEDDRFQPVRLATVVSSALFKRQVERIGSPGQRLFTDVEEALAWVKAAPAAPAGQDAPAA